MYVIIIATLLSLVVCLLKYSFGCNSVVTEFFNKDAITILGIIMTINAGSVVNLYMKLLNREEKYRDKGVTYNKMKHELKHNLIFSISSFFAIIMLMLTANTLQYTLLIYLYECCLLTVFILQIYALYETSVKFMTNI